MTTTIEMPPDIDPTSIHVERMSDIIYFQVARDWENRTHGLHRPSGPGTETEQQVYDATWAFIGRHGTIPLHFTPEYFG